MRGTATWEVWDTTTNTRVAGGTGTSGSADRLTHNRAHQVRIIVTDGVNSVTGTRNINTVNLHAGVNAAAFTTTTRQIVSGAGAMSYSPATQTGVSATWSVRPSANLSQVAATGTGATIAAGQANRLTHNTQYLVRLTVTDGYNTVTADGQNGTGTRTKLLGAQVRDTWSNTYQVAGQGRALVNGAVTTAGMTVDLDLYGVAYRANTAGAQQVWDHRDYPSVTHGSTWTMKAVVSDGFNKVEATQPVGLVTIPAPTCTVSVTKSTNPGTVVVNNTSGALPAGVSPRVIWDASGGWVALYSHTFGGIGTGTFTAYADNIDVVGQRVANPCGTYTITSGGGGGGGGGGGSAPGLYCDGRYVTTSHTAIEARWIASFGWSHIKPSPFTLTYAVTARDAANRPIRFTATAWAINRALFKSENTTLVFGCGITGT